MEEITELHSSFSESNIKQAIIIPHSQCIQPGKPFYRSIYPPSSILDKQTKLIFANLKKVDQREGIRKQFLDKIPEPTLAAVIWRLKVDYPEMCTLPHAVHYACENTNRASWFYLEKPNSRAMDLRWSIHLSENQGAGVKASLSLPLTDLALPTIFGNERK